MVTRARVQRLEEDAGMHDERPCDVCGKLDGWVLDAKRFVDPGTFQSYVEPAPPPLCAACGALPVVITISPRQGTWKRRGAALQTAVEMTDEEAGNWWIQHGGNEDLGRWFLSKAGLCEPPRKVNCRLIEYRECED